MGDLSSYKIEVGIDSLQDLMKKWWEEFERGNAPEVVSDLIRKLAAKKYKIVDFYWAYVYSENDEIQYNLDFLDFLYLLYPNTLREWILKRDKLCPNLELKWAGEVFRKGVSIRNEVGCQTSFVTNISGPVFFTEDIRTSTAIEKSTDRTQFLYGSRVHKIDSLEIVGKDDFIAQITSALILIKENAHVEYCVIKQYLGQIREWYQSGVMVYTLPPTFFVSRKVAFPSLTWCASCIAHEAHHSRLYHDYKSNNQTEVVPGNIYHGQDVELACNQFQLQVLEKLCAPLSEVEWLKQQTGSHWDLGWEEESLRPY